MNEQISPSQELVNKVISSIDEAPQKSKRTWHKTFIKFAIPAMFVLGIFCFPLIGNLMNNAVTLENSGNWFSLLAYAAEDTTFEITKNMKVILPAGNCTIESRDGGVAFGWKANFDEAGEAIPGGFTIKGENIKSVNIESKYGSFRDSLFIKYATDEELNARFMERGNYNANPVYLETDDISNLKYFVWQPEQLIESMRTGNYDEYKKEYMDTVIITVTFNDGEAITQIAEITVDENTGNIYAQIMG